MILIVPSRDSYTSNYCCVLEFRYLYDCLIVDEAQETTAQHGVNTRRIVTTNSPLTGVQFFVNNCDFKRSRIVSDSKAKQNSLSDRQNKDEKKHSIKN